MPRIEVERIAERTNRITQLVENRFTYAEAVKLVFLKDLVEKGRIGDLNPPLIEHTPLPPEVKPQTVIQTPSSNENQPKPRVLFEAWSYERELQQQKLSGQKLILTPLEEVMEAAQQQLTVEEPKKSEEPELEEITTNKTPTPREKFAKWLVEHGRITEE